MGAQWQNFEIRKSKFDFFGARQENFFWSGPKGGDFSVRFGPGWTENQKISGRFGFGPDRNRCLIHIVSSRAHPPEKVFVNSKI